ncbi:hypothetical protein J1614_007177 [Plenodomus biglobosus]|nr:hypothetical protein J1614_007177 [Plenodomus biglobosus]
MQFSKSSLLNLLALSSLTVAAPTPYDIVEGSTEEVQVIEDRAIFFAPFSFLLGKALISHAVGSGVSIGMELMKEQFQKEIDARKNDGRPDFKNFDEAREFTMRHLPADLLGKAPAGVKGVICMNQHYAIDAGSVHSEPIDIDFHWGGGYFTDYDCYEVTKGTVRYLGEGGYVNVGTSGCPYDNINKIFTC